MERSRCTICGRYFKNGKHHPHALTCGQPTCQRKRKQQRHQQRLASEEAYRKSCKQRQRKWHAAHPDYYKNYRQHHPDKVTRNRAQQQQRDRRRRLERLCARPGGTIEAFTGPGELEVVVEVMGNLAKRHWFVSRIHVVSGKAEAGAMGAKSCKSALAGCCNACGAGP